MSTLTIRMPEAMHARLRDLARARGVSINKLIEEMATATLSAHDAEVRFRLMAIRGKPQRALAILDRLDTADTRKGMAEAKRPFRAQRRKTTKK
jgi:predicted DNA-binding ribbon-helix-helix protein